MAGRQGRQEGRQKTRRMLTDQGVVCPNRQLGESVVLKFIEFRHLILQAPGSPETLGLKGEVGKGKPSLGAVARRDRRQRPEQSGRVGHPWE